MMQSKWNRIQSGTARGPWVALLSVLIIFLFAATANAAAPPMVVSQVTWYTAFPNGGVLAGDNGGGSSWGINSKGVAVASTTYGNQIIQFSGPGYAVTEAGPVAGAGGVAIDKNDNLYISTQYSNPIAKIPMNTDGTYTFTVDPNGSSASTLPVCTGVIATDQAAGECLINAFSTGVGYVGISAMTFNAAGDLFVVTDDKGTTAPFSIFQCTAKCLYPGTTPVAPVLIYSEPIASDPATTGQLYIGTVAFDPWGNLFFTDAAVVSSGNGQDANSHLNELAYIATPAPAHFATVPTVLATYNDPVPLAKYNDSIVTVYIDPTVGTVYFALQNGGTYALNNSKAGGVDLTSLRGLTSRGAKLMKADSYGNLLFVGYDNGNSADTLGYVSFGGPTFGASATTANIIVADNSGPCPAPLSFSFTDATYSAVAGGCGGMALGTGSFIPVTVTFTPGGGVTVPPIAALTITDTTSGDSTSVAAKGPALAINQSTFLAGFPSGGAFGGDSAGGTSGGINSKGVVVIGSSYGNGILQFTAGGTVVTNIGNTKFGGAGATTIDSHDYLYATTEYSNLILKFPMAADGTYAAIPATAAALAALPTCAGNGVAPDNAGICQMTPGGTTTFFSFATLTFDKNGVLFITSGDKTSGTATTNAAFSVLKCPATCLYGTTPGTASTATQPVVLFTEPAANSHGDQLYVGQIAVNSAGDVFFTDSQLDGGGNGFNHYGDLYELTPDNATATGYAAAPTLLKTLTPACGAPPCQYNNELDAVVVDAAGNVFFADQYSGIYEFPNHSGSYDFTNPIPVATPGAKTLILDGKGNFYFVGYSNDSGGDALGFDLIGKVAFTGAATAATPSTASVRVVDNFACVGGSPSLTFSFDNPDFAGPATAPNCGSLAFGDSSSFSATITYTPGASASGNVTGNMTVTDNNGGTGTAKLTALAATAQTITNFAGITSPVAFGGGPYTLTATAGAAGNPTVFTVSTTTGTQGIASITGDVLTITGVGTVVIEVDQAGGVVGGVTYAAGHLEVTITVDQAPQTITFAPASPIAFTATPITLSATGGASGLPVTFSIISGSDFGTLSGTNMDTLTITGVGAIVIAADQAGNANYLAATQVQKTITVNKAAQTIVFAPASTALYGSVVTLTATGGVSGNPVVLTLDATTTAGAATLSGNALTVTGPGTIVVDANQAGNANYAAATQVQATIAVTTLGTVATPVITPADGILYIGTTNTVTITDTTAGAKIYYTTDGSEPLLASNENAKVYSAPFTLPTVGSVTVKAAATLLGYTASATATANYTVSAIPPTFTIAASSPTLDIITPGVGTETITVAPVGGFNSAISFTCSSALPTGAKCSFSPATVTPGTTPNNQTVLSITTVNTQASLHRDSSPLFPATALAAVLCFFGLRKRRNLQIFLLLAISIVGMGVFSGCGGSKKVIPPPAKTTVTVTATSAVPAVTQTTTFSLTVTYQ